MSKCIKQDKSQPLSLIFIALRNEPLRWNVIYIENDRIEACLFLLTDVSYLHQLEAIRDNLVVNVSHELRTPITSIKGFTETLLDGELEDRETARHFLEIIQQESNRLEWLVNDVLDMARLEQATTTLQMEEVNIASLVEGICRSFSQKIEAKRISLEMAIPPQFLYQTDAMQFQQVVSNLLSNAIRYTDAEGTIRISLQEDSEQWWLAVQDTGIGISEQHLDKILIAFIVSIRVELVSKEGQDLVWRLSKKRFKPSVLQFP